MSTSTTPTPRAIALLPLALFLTLFCGAGVYYTLSGTDFAFYQLKAPIAILPAIVLALLLNKSSLNASMDRFVGGVADHNIILMCLVFLLAGAFASVTGAIGGVDATVNFGLAHVPAELMLPGLFVVSAFIATAMGTSMGTVAATAPIAAGFAAATGIDPYLALGAVVGGAMFGDNLSMISDTTIAATRSQSVEMKDKFKLNLLIALPAALITIGVLFVLGQGANNAMVKEYNLLLVLPYVVVLVLALSGLNVILVLLIGLFLSGAIGFMQVDNYQLGNFSNDAYKGFESMLEIMVLSMLIGGLSALMREQGGMAWITRSVQNLTQKLNIGRKHAGEVGVSLLVVATNLAVANNTVSIVITGPMARELAAQHGVDRRRTASLLDIFSCVIQGLIPYGAQILLASSLAALSPLLLAGNIYYCWILALVTIAAIIVGKPNLKGPPVVDEKPQA